MLQKISYAFFIVMLFLAGCQKDTIATPPSASNESLKLASASSLTVANTSKGWYGLYRYYVQDGDPDWQGDTLFDYDLIRNGIASFNDDLSLPVITGSSINYEIPLSHAISADSIVFETTVSSFSNKVELDILGVIPNTFAMLSIDEPVNGKRNVNINVGSSHKTITVKSALDLSSFQLIQFTLKGTTAFVYINSKLISKMPFKNTDRMGSVGILQMQNRLGKINCDKVRLLNSYTKKVTMEEAFTVDGQSHTIFY